jgi:hypothetical protein
MIYEVIKCDFCEDVIEDYYDPIEDDGAHFCNEICQKLHNPAKQPPEGSEQ